MSSFQIIGKIVEIFGTQTFGRGFRKREFVIETDEAEPQKVAMTLTQQNCDMIDSFDLGDVVKVDFAVKGREWNRKFFNTLEVYGITGDRASVARTSLEVDDILDDPELFPEKAQSVTVPPAQPEDDLPF